LGVTSSIAKLYYGAQGYMRLDGEVMHSHGYLKSDFSLTKLDALYWSIGTG
jgi:hypothetical protein